MRFAENEKLIFNDILASMLANLRRNQGTGSLQCGGEFKLEASTELEIGSPKFPESYPDKVQCLWVYEAPPGYQLSLTFSKFQV